MREWIRWSLRLGLAVALFYVAWTFLNRWQDTRRLAAEAESRQRVKAEGELDRAGGSSLKITQFYASPAVLSSGEAAELCYGVLFAEKLELTAQPMGEKLDHVWPSLQRCIAVKPKRSTEYMLKATDKAGAVAERKLTVEVR